MSDPRMNAPGMTWHINRCIIMQHFLLCPDEVLTNLIFYALAYTAQKYAIELHALCVMSDHYHMIVTDTKGVLPKFLQEFHRLVAVGVQKFRGWEYQVWESGPTSEIHLSTPEAVIEAIAYVMANPVAAGLVEHAYQWPGAKTSLYDLGRGFIEATRPGFYFDPENPQWLEKVSLPISLPPTAPKDRPGKFRRMVGVELVCLEKAAHREMSEKGRQFLGATKAMQVSPTDRATTSKPRGELNPTFAVGRGNAEALKECIERRRAFLNHYYGALERWRAGDRDAMFPIGTWWMRVFHKAKTADTA